jgi:hypothetical protein
MEDGAMAEEPYETLMQVSWQFDYDIGSEKLANLYSKSKDLQWDAEKDIDWTKPVDPSKPIVDEGGFGYFRLPFVQRLSESQKETFRAHLSAHRLSQFLHGEQGALMTAATLTHSVPDYEAKLYASTQTVDEARHVEAFEKLVRRVAIVYPMSPYLKGLIDATLKADHWVKIAIGMNMVIEGLALGAFHNMRRDTSCELLRDVIEAVMRDEARHVAFANIYTGGVIAEMHPDDREDVAEFALIALSAMAAPARRLGEDEESSKPRLMPRDPTFALVLENSEIDPADFMKGVREARDEGILIEPQPGSIDILRHLVMPALARTGVLTKRARAVLEDKGITVYDDTTVLEALENPDTGIVEL